MLTTKPVPWGVGRNAAHTAGHTIGRRGTQHMEGTGAVYGVPLAGIPVGRWEGGGRGCGYGRGLGGGEVLPANQWCLTGVI